MRTGILRYLVHGVLVAVIVCCVAGAETGTGGEFLSKSKADGETENDHERATPAVSWPGAGWEVATAEALRMDRALLEQAREYAQRSSGSGIITRSGKLVMVWGDQDLRYDLKSTSKSIGITALGLALHDRLVDLDEPARKHFPELGLVPPKNATTGWLGDVTIRQLATHTAGFGKSGGYTNLLFPPGTEWLYSDSGSNWLADLLTVIYKDDLQEVMFDRVFRHLGIDRSDLVWRKHEYREPTLNGYTRREFGSGVSANVDALARIGYLYLRKGQWRGKRIVPATFIDQVSQPVPGAFELPVRSPRKFAGAPSHYGLLWWNNADGTLANVPRDAFWSWGLLDSIIVVIPSLDIVAARAGKGWRRGWRPDYAVIEPFLSAIAQSVTDSTAESGLLNTGLPNERAADTTGDQITLISPSDQATVTGSIKVTAAAKDDSAITEISIVLDGVELGTMNAKPFVFDWNSNSVASGAHELGLIATDVSGNKTSTTATIYVDSLAEQPSGYPPSKIIVGLQWAPTSMITRAAHGSDNWPLAWADDGDMYAAYGDGWGFGSEMSRKLSLGYARIVGPPNAFIGENISSPTGEQTGDGPSGKKASSLLMVKGILYQWVRNADRNGSGCELAWSMDHSRSWQWSDWLFDEFGYCEFLDFGPNYQGARDSYVYMYSPDSPSGYKEADHLILARVPIDRITDRSAYEFVAGFDGSQEALWTTQPALRAPIFSFGGAVNRLDVSYHPGLGRYLMTLRSRAQNNGRNQFSIFEGQEPWGPWHAVYYTERWDGAALSNDHEGWGESQHIPPKWMSPDGKTIYLVFSGDDAFSLRSATLTVAPSPGATAYAIPEN